METISKQTHVFSTLLMQIKEKIIKSCNSGSLKYFSVKKSQTIEPLMIRRPNLCPPASCVESHWVYTIKQPLFLSTYLFIQLSTKKSVENILGVMQKSAWDIVKLFPLLSKSLIIARPAINIQGFKINASASRVADIYWKNKI